MPAPFLRRIAAWSGIGVAIAVFGAVAWVIEILTSTQVWYRGQTVLAYEAVNIARANALFTDRGIQGRFVGGLVVGGAPVDYCDPLLEFWFGEYIVVHQIMIVVLMIACIVMAIALWKLYAKVARLEAVAASPRDASE
ncbi:MAG: hypothetical protein U0638_07005 [Phycisphaerales bacterium]